MLCVYCVTKRSQEHDASINETFKRDIAPTLKTVLYNFLCQAVIIIYQSFENYLRAGPNRKLKLKSLRNK